MHLCSEFCLCLWLTFALHHTLVSCKQTDVHTKSFYMKIFTRCYITSMSLFPQLKTPQNSSFNKTRLHLLLYYFHMMPVNRLILKYLNVGIFLFPQKKWCKEIITHAKSVELINLVFKSYSMCDLKWSKHTEVQHWWRVVASAVVSDQIDFSLPLLLLNSQLGPAVAVSTETAEEDEHRPQEPEPCRKQEMSGHRDKENKQTKET